MPKAEQSRQTNIDIEDRTQAEEALRANERSLYLTLNAIPMLAWSARPDGFCDFLSQHWLDYTGLSQEEARGWGWGVAIHPDDAKRIVDYWQAALASGTPVDTEGRLRRFNGEYRRFLFRANPLRDESGTIIKWYGTNMDIEDRKRADEKLRQSEADLLEAQRISHTGSWKHDVASGRVTITPEVTRIFGVAPDEDASTAEFFFSRIHPEDRPLEAISYERAARTKADFESYYRILLPDGSIRHVHNVGHPKVNEAGELVEFVGTVLDVTAAKQAEAKLRQSEREARQLLDLSPMHVTEFGPDGTRLYNNRAALDYYGLTLEQWRGATSDSLVHPQDAELVNSEVPRQFLKGSPYEIEVRLKRKDGQYRWFHYRFNPMLDEQGRITRWYAAGTDIEDRKLAEQRLQSENVSLREEVDKVSMFEEIVGNSEKLRQVLAHVVRVGPADSSVLITGETGTGKELVARAIHRRSPRAKRAFIAVNCAAIPQSLIASELFGHEKGSFTGALQQRLGRFELADGGTIFLDEVGELSLETQVALLRVLQERELQRVGGSRSISVDVRVIAATNRDLKAAIEAGTFRQDLFYRLSVFPIHIPALRERAEDIPILVEYMTDRYANKMGKRIRNIEPDTLGLFRRYPWPGNVRELQNVVERAVILSEGETLRVDEAWFQREQLIPEPVLPPSLRPAASLRGVLMNQEKEMIESALRESRGRVSGPSGAAAKLGMPAATLESKIRSLGIRKHIFKD